MRIKQKDIMIVAFLMKEGKMASTGRIAAEIKSNQYVTEAYLERLEEEGKVTRIEVPNAVYWELTKSTSTLKKEGNKK